MKIHYLTAKELVATMGYNLPSGGNVYGYQTAARITREGLVLAGVEFSEDAKVCLQYTPPHWFTPLEGKINVLFSMWEAENIPPDLLGAFEKADYVVVPAKNTRDAIRRGGVATPVAVCTQACDTDFFGFRERPFTGLGGVVRFLWVGAPNIRKGYDLAIQAFYDAFHKTGEKVELYVKSTLEGKDGKITPLTKFNALVDTRDFTREELRELYWSAQVFLYPSRGEGAGLPLLEAMSTGLPVIAPNYSGMRDYMLPDHSYPVKWSLVDCEYGVETRVCEADLDDLTEVVRKVYDHLPDALEKGRKAAVYVRACHDKGLMGLRLLRILEAIERKFK